jgi:chromate transport protein ChrA
MSTQKPAAPPQSVALVWTVLTHVLVLPVAASYLPALLPQTALSGAPEASTVAPFLLSGLFAALIVVLHGVIWRMARGEGRRRLAQVIAGLGVVSLATLVLLGTPAPLLVLARLVGVVL